MCDAERIAINVPALDREYAGMDQRLEMLELWGLMTELSNR